MPSRVEGTNDNNDCNYITDIKVIQSSYALTLRNTYFITHTIGGTNVAEGGSLLDNNRCRIQFNTDSVLNNRLDERGFLGLMTQIGRKQIFQNQRT